MVVDLKVAWTGSMNLVDPKFFKQEANVGEWVDAMVRMEGTVVGPLALTMLGDWMNEAGGSIHDIIDEAERQEIRPKGSAALDVSLGRIERVEADLSGRVPQLLLRYALRPPSVALKSSSSRRRCFFLCGGK